MRCITTKTFATIATALLLCLSNSVLAKKVYTPSEQKTEEARIIKDIEESLDWKNRPPETLDGVADADRWLYGRTNESILLRKATGERFGIFESFDDRTNTKIFEIRLHKKNKLTDRFRPFQNECDGESLSVEKSTVNFILFREICSAKGRPTGNSLYLFNYANRELYWIYTAKVIEQKKPTILLKGDAYSVRWEVQLIGNARFKSIIRNFRISKDKTEKWTVKNLHPINDEVEGVTAVETLPLKPEYNLPAFVADWGN